MSLISILVVVLVLCLFFWGLRTLAAAFGLPKQIEAVITVLIVILAILWLVSGIAGINVPLRIR